MRKRTQGNFRLEILINRRYTGAQRLHFDAYFYFILFIFFLSRCLVFPRTSLLLLLIFLFSTDSGGYWSHQSSFQTSSLSFSLSLSINQSQSTSRSPLSFRNGHGHLTTFWNQILSANYTFCVQIGTSYLGVKHTNLVYRRVVLKNTQRAKRYNWNDLKRNVLRLMCALKCVSVIHSTLPYYT